MIDPFSWESWGKVYLHKKDKKRASLERYGLRNLHSVASLDFIVSKVNELYSRNKKDVVINVESVWIDGTPQAKFTTIDGSVLNCELADLLFLVREIDDQNVTTNFRGVLLQGKCSERHDLLPSGPSTKKERKLLESIDRNKHLILYPGTRAYGEAIGEYILGEEVMGLADCAKFLMMPKNKSWNYKTPDSISPYVIGWPKKLFSNSLINNSNYLDSILSEMIVSRTMGKEISLTKMNHIDTSCEWSRMINDLLNSYLPVTMRGYNSQRRVYQSSSFITNIATTLALTDYDWSHYISECDFECIPKGRERFLSEYSFRILMGHPEPVISTIYIEIKQNVQD
ncbi:lysogenic conversion protein [Providencia stuartii]|uniref:lysogenic conversion protein n=1 Tax=Providencia stuartii TaxID=588 RepID=UPI0034E5D4F8